MIERFNDFPREFVGRAECRVCLREILTARSKWEPVAFRRPDKAGAIAHTPRARGLQHRKARRRKSADRNWLLRATRPLSRKIRRHARDRDTSLGKDGRAIHISAEPRDYF